MVNDRFLRSGAEFGPANNATADAKRYDTHLIRGRDARANDFAARMLGESQHEIGEPSRTIGERAWGTGGAACGCHSGGRAACKAYLPAARLRPPCAPR